MGVGIGVSFESVCPPDTELTAAMAEISVRRDAAGLCGGHAGDHPRRMSRLLRAEGQHRTEGHREAGGGGWEVGEEHVALLAELALAGGGEEGRTGSGGGGFDVFGEEGLLAAQLQLEEIRALGHELLRCPPALPAPVTNCGCPPAGSVQTG